MQRFIILIGAFLLLTHLNSCTTDVACTEIFKSIDLEVNGATLDTYYTIRLGTNDTIYHSENLGNSVSNYYTILNDNYRTEIDEPEHFVFIGEIDNQKVINETYSIGADECHIYLESGITSIDL